MPFEVVKLECTWTSRVKPAYYFSKCNNFCVSRGMPAKKIALGLGTYGRGFTLKTRPATVFPHLLVVVVTKESTPERRGSWLTLRFAP